MKLAVRSLIRWLAIGGGLLAVFLSVVAPSHSIEAADLSAIRIGKHPDKTRFVLEFSETPAYRVFSLPDPARVVIDLPELNWKIGDKDIPKPTGAVTALRSGLFEPGVSRMVLDLRYPVSLKEVFLIPPRGGHGPRLVVDMARVSRETYLASGEQERRILSSPPLQARAIDGAPRQNTAPATAAEPPTASVSAPIPKPNPLRVVPERKIVVIDPGHGGVDPGAIGISGIKEKDLALRYAKEFKAALERTGRYKVILTRKHDSSLALRQRIALAQEAEGDLFISLHANKHSSSRIRGASVYTLSEKGSDKEANALAAKENKADIIAGFDFSDQSEVVSKILIDLAQRETNNQGKHFANILVGELKRETALLRRPHRSAGFAVLKSPIIPSVLVELGYMSNREEERKLRSDSHRNKLIRALTRAVDQYFGKLETYNLQ